MEFSTMSYKTKKTWNILDRFQQDFDGVSQALTLALKRQGMFL